MGSNEPGALPRGLPEQNQELKSPPRWDHLPGNDYTWETDRTPERVCASLTRQQKDGWTKTMEPRPEGAAPLCYATHLAGQEDKEAL